MQNINQMPEVAEKNMPTDAVHLGIHRWSGSEREIRSQEFAPWWMNKLKIRTAWRQRRRGEPERKKKREQPEALPRKRNWNVEMRISRHIDVKK
jgi:hypothetical protein